MNFPRHFILFILCSFASTYSIGQGIDSAHHYRSTSFSSVEAITSDNDGNLFVSGFYTDSLWLPGGHLLTGSTTDPFMFIASYDVQGELRWAKIINSNYQARIRMETDDSGNVYVGTLCKGNFYLDYENRLDLINTGSGPQSFILKMDTDGENKWYVSTYGSTGYSKVDFLDFLIAGNNDLFWMITAMGDISFASSTPRYAGPIELGDKFLNRPGTFLIRTKNPLNRPISLAAKFSDPDRLVSGYSMVERDGKIVIAGDYYGPIDMDPGSGTSALTGSGGYYCCVDTNMQFQWVRKSTLEQVMRMEVNTFNQIKAFGSETGVGNSKLDIGSLGFDGKIHFENRSSFNKIGMHIGGTDADRAGNVFLSGSFNGTGDFDPTAQTRTQFASRPSTFLAKYDSSNALTWIVIGRGTATTGNWGFAVDISPDNRLTWGGSFNKLFGITNNNHVKFPNVNYSNGYLAFLTECKSLKASLSPSSSLICLGDSASLKIEGAQTALWNGDSSTLLERKFSPNVLTFYGAEVSDGKGCYSKVSARIDVAPLPEPKITQVDNKIICQDKWQKIDWYLDDELVSGENDTAYFPDESGTIYCVVRDSNSCSGKSNELVFEHIGLEDFRVGDGRVYYSNGAVYFDFADGRNVGNAMDVSVWSTTGKLLLESSLVQGERRLALTLASGTYILKMQDSSTGLVLRKKFVVTEG